VGLLGAEAAIATGPSVLRKGHGFPMFSMELTVGQSSLKITKAPRHEEYLQTNTRVHEVISPALRSKEKTVRNVGSRSI